MSLFGLFFCGLTLITTFSTPGLRHPHPARDSAAVDQSGASIFGTIAKAIPSVVEGVGSLFGGDNNNKREIEHLVLREFVTRAADADQSGASIFGTIAKAIPSVVEGLGSLFGGGNNNKREVEDIVMRAVFEAREPILSAGISKVPINTPTHVFVRDDAQSGASIFGTIAKAIPSVVEGLGSLFGGDNNNKREMEVLLTRHLLAARAEADQSGASIFGTIAKAIPSVVEGLGSLFGGDNNNKRDIEHLVLREFIARAADADQSGASIFGTIAKAIPSVVEGLGSLFGGGNNNNKRDVETLLMRELVARAAADADQSGASIFGTIAKAIPSVVEGLGSLFGGDNNNKREIANVLVRSLLDDTPVARRYVFLLIHHCHRHVTDSVVCSLNELD